MHPINVTVFIAWTCLAVIIQLSKSDTSSILDNTTAQVLKLCYKNVTRVVGVAGDSDDLIIRALHFDGSLAVTLIGARSVLKNAPVHQEQPYRLQVFLVVASSALELGDHLNGIKNSTWWNHMASFLILDRPPGPDQGCSNAFDILWTAWKMDILNAKFVCHHPTRDRLIYSFNPYTNKAPDPWTLEKTYRPNDDHPCALFTRSYQLGPTTCEMLDFDKTADIGGHEIRSSELVSATRYCANETRTKLNQIILQTLNGSHYPVKCHGPHAVGRRTHNISEEVFGEVLYGISDIVLNNRFQILVTNFTTTYPHWYTGLSVVTQHPGYKSPLSKIRTVVDSKTHRGFYVVLLITVLFFKFPLRLSGSSVMLDTMRIISGLPLEEVPGNVALRTYLGSLFLAVVTIRALYQSDLSALLTLPVPLPTVESMQDLVKLGHTIYGNTIYAQLFQNSSLEQRFVGLEIQNCTPYVLSDPSAACIQAYDFLLNDVEGNDLHMCRKMLFSYFVVYPIRENWPLEQRLNMVLSRMSETGIIPYWKKRPVMMKIERLDFIKEFRKRKKFRVITLDELNFAFVILGIGLSCAIVVFVAEIKIVDSH